MKQRHLTRRIVVAALTAGFFAAIASAYFFFPATAKNILKSTAAIAVQSWDDTFGGTDGGYVSEIGLAAGDAEGSSTASSSAIDENQGQEVMANGDSENPMVTLEMATDTASVATDTTNLTDTADLGDTTDNNAALPPAPSPAHCTVSTAAALSRELIFNEVAWMGSPPRADETASAASNHEWIELKNISGNGLDVSGWQVVDAAGNIKIVFGEGTMVPVGGLLLLERGEDAVSAVQADKVYTGGLSNAGGVLAVVDGVCGASDVLDASAGWPAGNNGTKQTLERDVDNIGWHTSAAPGGTPRAENSVAAVSALNATSSTNAAGTNNTVTNTAATNTTTTTDTATIVMATSTTVSSTPQACATTTATTTTTTTATSTVVSAGSHLLIVEVQIAGASSANDFVKIFNPGADMVDVSGWRLRKKSKTGTDYSLRIFPEGNAVAANGYFTWANAEDGFGDSIGANVTSTATLAADNSVALLDANGNIVDAVAWGEGTGQYVEAAAYPTNPEAGQILTRKTADGAPIDTNDNTSDFTIQ